MSLISSSDVQRCDRLSDRVIAGVMAEFNKKEHNEDNTVSNQRTEEHPGKSSRYWLLLRPLEGDINTEEG